MYCPNIQPALVLADIRFYKKLIMNLLSEKKCIERKNAQNQYTKLSSKIIYIYKHAGSFIVLVITEARIY